VSFAEGAAMTLVVLYAPHGLRVCRQLADRLLFVSDAKLALAGTNGKPVYPLMPSPLMMVSSIFRWWPVRAMLKIHCAPSTAVGSTWLTLN
jgi:hypothetical protein